MQVGVGVGVILRKEDKVLVGKRIGMLGFGTWGFPGGKLEFGESLAACVNREVFEETGVTVKNISYGPYTNDIFAKEEKQFVTLFVIADYKSGKVRVMEPEKCEEWRWVPWNDLPQPLFLPIENLLKQHFNPNGY